MITPPAPNRRIVLALLGVLWVLTAIRIPYDERRTGLVHEELPVPVRVALWLLPAVVALAAVWWRRLDAWAWTLLIAGPLVSFASFGWGWVLGLYPAGWRGAVVYATTIMLVNRCAAGLDRCPVTAPAPAPAEPEPWDGVDRRQG